MVTQRLEKILGTEVLRQHSLSGGYIAKVSHMVMCNGMEIVVKQSDQSGDLLCEGRMLTYLSQNSELPVPEVIYSDVDLLVMSCLPNDGQLNNSAQRDAARHIASLHSLTIPKGFGLANETVIAGLPQKNHWCQSWPDFYGEQRLLPMAERALRAGHITTQAMALLEKLITKLPEILPGDIQPSLLHGDLWGGNILVTGQGAEARISGFIDPALYYGDAEMDLAFSTLFNSFGPAFFDAYQTYRPLLPGFWQDRRDLYNLYPLLVHATLFGGGYGAQAAAVITRYV